MHHMWTNARRFIALLSFSLALSACLNPEDKIVGAWQVDFDATLAADATLSATMARGAEAASQARELSQGFTVSSIRIAKAKQAASEVLKLKELSFKFASDGSMTVNRAGEQENGSYRVKSAHGDKIVLFTKGEDGKEEIWRLETKDGIVLFLDMGKQRLVLRKR